MEESNVERSYIKGRQAVFRTAHQVDPNEGCFGLSEQNLNLDSRGWKRYRIIYVIRGDEIAEYWRLMGPRENFKCEPFRITTGFQHPDGKIEICHTVAEAEDIADTFHDEPLEFDVKPRDILNEWYNQLELHEWLRKGKRVF